MSNSQPDHPAAPGAPTPEYLGSGDGPAGDGPAGGGRRRGARTGLVAAGAVAVVAAVGVGAYGVSQFMGGGESPASVVPADALGYASLDLDPSASQKIEAIKIMRKFPGLRDQLDISSRDDLRRTIWKAITSDGGCTGVDYDKDLKPWLGERIAVAAVPGSSTKVLPLVVVQVKDEDQARAGIKKLEDCDTNDELKDGSTGVAFSGDYLLATGTQADATRMADDAEHASLQDDAAFGTWMDRVGDPGIVTMYASKKAPAAMLDGSDGSDGALGKSGVGSELGGGSSKALREAFGDFGGAAGVIRFKDGAVESEFATQGLGRGVTAATTDGPSVTSLPDTTAAALSIALPEGWASKYLDQIEAMAGASGDADSMVTQLEMETGLQIPQDIETLLGKGLTVSVDSSTDLDRLGTAPDPTQVPAGLRIEGDTTKITAVIEKLKSLAGAQGDVIKVRSGDGVVAVGTDEDYVAQLLQDGGLGDSRAFKDVVPEAGRATSVLYVNFDAGDGWAGKLAHLISGGDAGVEANVKPLDALGVSSWQDDDEVQHALLRLTTD